MRTSGRVEADISHACRIVTLASFTAFVGGVVILATGVQTSRKRAKIPVITIGRMHAFFCFDVASVD